MATTDAAALARSKERPSVILPRWRWVPWVGPVLARVLPPKTHHGITLSYDEFVPFRDAWLEEMKKLQAGEGDEDSFREMVSDFLRAQRLPVRDIFALPGAPLQTVIEDLFLYQSRMNLAAPIFESLMGEVQRNRTGNPSPGKGPRKMRTSLVRTPS